jgi:hypothetical protein
MRDGALLGVNPGRCTAFPDRGAEGDWPAQRVLETLSALTIPRRISETKQCGAMAPTHHSYAPLSEGMRQGRLKVRKQQTLARNGAAK